MDKHNEVNLDQPFRSDAPDGDTIEAQTEIKSDAVPQDDLDKPKVPYSRFENVSRARREAEAETDKWRERAMQLEQSRQSAVQPINEMPLWWTKLYGDTEQTKEAYQIWAQGQQGVIEQAKQEALQELRLEGEQRQSAVKDNLKTIDEGLDNLSAFIGRDLTEKEQSDVLDIVDEYTPKDDDGYYMGATIPFDKAWEIYEMKNNSSKAPTRQSRDNAARAISNPSNGQPSSEQLERDKAFQPRNWGSWQERLGKE